MHVFLRSAFRNYLLILIVISLLPLYSLLKPGLPITHDGIDHVARIANFYKSLSEGILIPRWAANLNWGYGHPILMFLYPLPSYFSSIVHFFGFNFIDSLKIVFGISFIASGVAMYLWVRDFLGDRAALIAGLLYTFAPYRFIDLYVRGAIGEHVAFVFPPLVLFFLLRLSEEKKFNPFYFSGASISFCFLILSHNAISLMFVPFIVFYIIYLFWEKKQKTFLIVSGASLGLGLLLSFFFWFPAFFEGKYTLRDIVTKNTYRDSFVKPLSLLYGKWDFGGTGHFSVQIGIPQIIFLITSPLILIRLKKTKFSLLFWGILIYFCAGIFLMLRQSDSFYQFFSTLGKIQFPWRFLSVVVFSTSLVGAFSFKYLVKNKYQNLILVTTIALILITTFTYWRAKAYIQKPDSFFKGIYKSTTDTGESAPIWSVRFMEHIPKTHIEVISGTAKIKETKRTTIDHLYQIIVITDAARIRENTLYFPGWKVLVDGSETNIQFQDPTNRGLMTFYLPRGKHLVDVEFGETKLREFSDILSMIGILGIVSIISLGIFMRKHD